MRKFLMAVFASIFVMPGLCDYALMEAKIEKKYNETGTSKGKNEFRPDSVSMDYDIPTGTIVISSMAENDKDVDIKIYKDGMKVYEDHDNIGKGCSLNYTMTDEESGEYDVRVTVDGEESINETVLK